MRTAVALILLAAACGKGAAKPEGGITPQQMADAINTVVAADRGVYTREVVNRLQNDEKVIKASAHFKDDKALPLPAQMLRMGAEAVRKDDHGFTYALVSLWPINRQNAPTTAAEKAGLETVAKGGKPYYAEETLGGKTYFTAVYPDKAVSEACVKCHNENPDSPRADFKVGDVMGGLVVRIPVR